MAGVSSWVRQAGVVPMLGGRVGVVTSSSGKRWVIPKGLIDPGKTAGEAALQEAWEEAGLVGILLPEPIGSYVYTKLNRQYHVTVFLMRVHEALSTWPERHLRQREWLLPELAASRIDEPGLRDLLLNGLPTTPDVTPTSSVLAFSVARR
jgi:8-oxo-dGTP pyrophosphatase MutT (NUDIX family)